MPDERTSVVLDECHDNMKKAITHTQAEFAAIRTGRATPALVERIKVECYGSEVPLQQVAGVTVPESRMLVLSPYDKSLLAPIEKAIQHSDLGINPSNDGSVIRLIIPPLTQERRKELVKAVRNKAEDGRVAVRGARRNARQSLEKLEKDGDISKDELEGTERKLEGITKKYIDEIERMLEQKEQELMEV